MDDSPGRRLEAVIEAHMAARGRRYYMRTLARESGVAAQTIYRWYRSDAAPEFRSLEAVAHALGVTGTELFAAWEGIGIGEAEALLLRRQLALKLGRERQGRMSDSDHPPLPDSGDE